MRDVEVDSLRKHILKEVYSELPFRIISGGVEIGVVISSSEYNRLRFIEYIELARQKNDKKLSEFIAKTLWHDSEKPPKEWNL